MQSLTTDGQIDQGVRVALDGFNAVRTESPGLISAKDLRALGAEIIGVVCVIDREQGGREALAKDGLELRPLFTRKELEAAK